ncbi:hypothetical protein [Stenotrophomonas indicatrix]|uniref:hypothetical protein n=1 Tax=Stenotrophomonas indicatrix TaxID=2045451 RepID=UPI00215A2902|nr:hypothetical protein [Stenotrophomonas indicatrix]MCR8714391.1 hypothetical protein [Stenotrophomonas indicatrix]
MNRDLAANRLTSTNGWINSPDGELVRKRLLEELGAFQTVVVLHHHFGQAEEYFVLMVDRSSIVEVEVSSNGVEDFSVSSIADYLRMNRKLPASFRFDIEVARALS